MYNGNTHSLKSVGWYYADVQEVTTVVKDLYSVHVDNFVSLCVENNDTTSSFILKHSETLTSINHSKLDVHASILNQVPNLTNLRVWCIINPSKEYTFLHKLTYFECHACIYDKTMKSLEMLPYCGGNDAILAILNCSSLPITQITIFVVPFVCEIST